MTRCNL